MTAPPAAARPAARPESPGGPPFCLMGVLNATPDSFSDGGRFRGADEAVAAGLRMAAEGAAVLDVGGESTRPGARRVPADEQIRRVVPVIRGLREALGAGVLLSVDTTRAAVAEAAAEAGEHGGAWGATPGEHLAKAAMVGEHGGGSMGEHGGGAWGATPCKGCYGVFC